MIGSKSPASVLTPYIPSRYSRGDVQPSLWSATEIDQDNEDIPVLATMLSWVRNFLAKPHADLGRPGPVCPFIPKALAQNSVYFAITRLANYKPEDMEQVLRTYRSTFSSLPPRIGEGALLKCILIVFPEVQVQDAFTVIDGVQRRLKAFFVEEGLMLGEFHQGNRTPGLHNPNFFPLASPYPTLAIRSMVPSDLPFLMREFDKPELRVKFLTTYLARLAEVASERQMNDAKQALATATDQVQRKEVSDER